MIVIKFDKKQDTSDSHKYGLFDFLLSLSEVLDIKRYFQELKSKQAITCITKLISQQSAIGI